MEQWEQGRERSAPRLRSRAYAHARRHTRVVRLLKWAIPTGAALGVAGVVGWAVIDPFQRLAGLSLGPVSVSGTQVTMENPKLSGFRSRSGAYEVTASTATQDLRNPGRVELNELRARVATDASGGVARLEADTGVLDTQKERLDLRRNVRVSTDKGQEAHLHSASIDLKTGTVLSEEPVSVALENATIEAKGVEVLDGGRVIHFKGRVSAVLADPGPELGAGTPAPVPSARAQTSQAEPMSVRR